MLQSLPFLVSFLQRANSEERYRLSVLDFVSFGFAILDCRLGVCGAAGNFIRSAT